MHTTRSISVVLAIISISLWIALGLYFIFTNHWGVFAIAPLLLPLFIFTLIADAMCFVVLVNGIKRHYFDRAITVFVFITSGIIVLVISQ